jgi:phage terminase small subunit
MTPARKLPESEPAALKKHPVAAAEWRRLIRMYNGLEADIVTRLDMGMLLDYCMLLEQLEELDELRQGALQEWRAGKKILETWREQDDKQAAEDPEHHTVDLKTFIRASEAVNWAYDKIIKVDGRVDRKRALLLQLRQSLYLTPRSRAGVAPAEKAPEEPEDEMTRLLNES